MIATALSLTMNRAAPRLISCKEEFVSLKSGEVEWAMRADVVEELLPAIRQTIEGIPGPAQVESVKTGPHRTVYRLRLASGDYYLKHFRIADRKALLQNVVRPSKAELEWRAAQKIAALGLPTFEPVALGKLVRTGIVRDSFLVSRGIPDAQPLDELAAAELSTPPGIRPPRAVAARRSALRQSLTVELGRLAARIHLAAIEHADFHSANVLVRVGPDSASALWLIDLHKVHFRTRLSAGDRYNNLAVLHQFFAGKSTRADRLRFYRAYRDEFRGGGVNVTATARTPSLDSEPREREEIARVEGVLAAGAARGWIRADRAWSRGNRHVRKLEDGAASCRGLATLDASWLRAVRDDPDRLFRDHLIRWHKQTAKHRVAEVGLPESANARTPRAFLKCIEPAGFWRRWLAHYRVSAVRRCWEVGHALLRRGIDTPRPILYIERRAPQDYLLTEAVPGSIGVREFFESVWPGMSAAERRHWLLPRLCRLAQQMRRLHAAGFDHRDLKFANLLVATSPADPRVWLLDLDGVRFWRRVPAGRVAQNLARINVSTLVAGPVGKTDRLRFLRWYLDRDFQHEWKRWWRRIARLSQDKIQENQRRQRPLS